jgi:hypothetical protein
MCKWMCAVGREAFLCAYRNAHRSGWSSVGSRDRVDINVEGKTLPPRAVVHGHLGPALQPQQFIHRKNRKKKKFYKCMTVHDKLHRIDLFFSLIMGLATSSIRTGARRLSKEEKFNCKNARLGQTQDLDLQTQVSAPKLFFLIIQLSTLF